MINHEKFRALYNERGGNCVSIYIPTQRAGNIQKDSIELKNALKEAEERLVERGVGERDAEAFLQKANDLLDDKNFWQNQSDGLAMFIGEDRFETYTCPVEFERFVYVAGKFYLRPLLPMLTDDHKFFILTLSEKNVRFYEADPYSITPIEVDHLFETNLEDALMLDEPFESLQFHSSGSTNAKAPNYHGHGGEKDNHEGHLKEFLHIVDNGLNSILCNDKAPLIVCGAEEIASMYKNISKYNYVVDNYVNGNVDEKSHVEVHELAWAEMQNVFTDDCETKLENWGNQLAGNLASFSIHDVVPAALNGRVETLYVNKDARVWGMYDRSTNEVELQEGPGDRYFELLEEAAIATYLAGGKVYNVSKEELLQPTSDINAIYRYNY